MKRRRNPRQAAQDALFEDARLPQSRKELKLLAQAMNGKKGSRGMRKAVGAKRIIGRRFTRHNGRYRNASVEVGADWTLLQQFELHKFEALHTSEPTVTDLHWAGSLKSYNSTLDSVDVKSAAPVRVNPKTDFFMVRPAEDPVLEELAEADLGNVFATEAVLAALMAAPRSAAPWDVVVTYLPGGMIFLDVRDAAEFESVSVHETARRAPHEKEEYDGDINTAGALSEEATRVNRALTQSVLKRQAAAAGKPAAETLGIDLKPHPFFDEEEAEEGHTPAHMAYRYRRFDVRDAMARKHTHSSSSSRASGGVVANDPREQSQIAKEICFGAQYYNVAGIMMYKTFPEATSTRSSCCCCCCLPKRGVTQRSSDYDLNDAYPVVQSCGYTIGPYPRAVQL